MPSSIDSAAGAFRARYRAEVLPARYDGWRHVIGVAVLGLCALGGLLWFASSRWAPVHFWTVPATLLLANSVEYLAHRGPMHHRTRGLQLLHLRHACRHHRYFTDRAMHFEGARDFHAVLFPPLLLLFFGAIAGALGVLAALVLPLPVAVLFVATAISYYLLYELLHFLYHVPSHWTAARLPGVRWLARLHRVHHAPQAMQQRNFNLVFPLWDWLAGTLETDAPRPTPCGQPVRTK